MRKLLILLLLLSIANSYAGPPADKNLPTEKMIDNFNNWLSENGHSAIFRNCRK